MRIVNNIKTNFYINSSMIANAIVYYLKKLPILKKLISDNAYSAYNNKRRFAILTNILYYLFKIATKFIYLSIMMLTPMALIYDEIPPNAYIHFVQLFFGLSIIIGSINSNITLSNYKEKYIHIKLIRADAKDFSLSSILYYNIINSVLFIPALIVFTLITKGSVAQTMILIVHLISARFITESVLLIIYDKLNFNLLRNNYVLLSLYLILFAPFYIMLYFDFTFGIYNYLFSWYGIVISTLLFILSLKYLVSYDNYKKAINNSIIIDNLNINVEQALFNDVKIKDDKQIYKSNDNKLEGYQFLNHLFFIRHSKHINRKINIILILSTIAFVGGLIATLITGFEYKESMVVISRYFPMSIFIIYVLNTGEKATKAMFYNCDWTLLNYSFYREKKALLENFMIRFKKLALINLCPTLLISVYIYILNGLISGYWLDYRLIPIIISLNLLPIFFSVHFLFAYYLLQPYSTQLQIKNPFYGISNVIIYAIAFSTLYIKETPSYFPLIIIALIIIYVTIAIMLIYKFAPRTFRLK